MWVVIEVEPKATVQNKEDQAARLQDWILPPVDNGFIMFNKTIPIGNGDVQ